MNLPLRKGVPQREVHIINIYRQPHLTMIQIVLYPDFTAAGLPDVSVEQHQTRERAQPIIL